MDRFGALEGRERADGLSRFLLRETDFIKALQIEPEFCASAEEMSKALTATWQRQSVPYPHGWRKPAPPSTEQPSNRRTAMTAFHADISIYRLLNGVVSNIPAVPDQDNTLRNPLLKQTNPFSGMAKREARRPDDPKYRTSVSVIGWLMLP
jgi:hypothetical protein